jgi:hypothetical protein
LKADRKELEKSLQIKGFSIDSTSLTSYFANLADTEKKRVSELLSDFKIIV